MTIQYLQGDVLKCLDKLEPESINLCITSPPYWGQRSYVPDGDPLKEFEIGLEPTPEEFIDKLVKVFDGVKRVLRRDGVLIVNLGDCYITSPPGNKPNTTALSSGLPNSVASQEMRRAAQSKINKLKAVRKNTLQGWADVIQQNAAKQDGLYDRKMDLQIGHGEDRRALWDIRRNAGLSNKELVGAPWMLVFAMRKAGWKFRQEIIWDKNPMPESCRDRFTKAHEHLLFFVRDTEGYYWNHAAAQERVGGETRNRRTVMRVTVEPFPDAHFATFPQKLVEPFIQIACPPGGTVLDPFGGAGTVGLVASRLQRNAVLVELWPPYVEMAKRRIQRHAGMAAGVDWARQRVRARRPKTEITSKVLITRDKGGRGKLSTSPLPSSKAP